jgi:hypothetical protein
MEVSGHIHAPAVSVLEKEKKLPTGLAAEWVLEPV